MKQFKNDSDQVYFLENELESIKERIYEEYPTQIVTGKHQLR